MFIMTYVVLFPGDYNIFSLFQTLSLIRQVRNYFCTQGSHICWTQGVTFVGPKALTFIRRRKTLKYISSAIRVHVHSLTCNLGFL